jgi:hypothetical protein
MADWFTEIAQQRWEQLDAEEAQAQAQLKYAKANDDREYGVERVAELESMAIRKRALQDRHAQYLRDSQPPQRQERESIITSHRTPQSGDDALEIVNYGKMPNDPTRLSVEVDPGNRTKR